MIAAEWTGTRGCVSRPRNESFDDELEAARHVQIYQPPAEIDDHEIEVVLVAAWRYYRQTCNNSSTKEVAEKLTVLEMVSAYYDDGLREPPRKPR